jgi:hypothetical protein
LKGKCSGWRPSSSLHFAGQPNGLSLREFVHSSSQPFLPMEQMLASAEVHLGRLRTASYMSFFSETEFSAKDC